MKYTHHALKRFAERYPDLNLEEEQATMRPAPKRVMKKIAKKSDNNLAIPTSNLTRGGGRIYSSDGGAIAVTRQEDKDLVVVTFLTNPDEIYHKDDYPNK